MCCQWGHGDFAARHGEGAVAVPVYIHIKVVVVGVLGDVVVNNVAWVGVRCQCDSRAYAGRIRRCCGSAAHNVVEADSVGLSGADHGKGQVKTATCA